MDDPDVTMFGTAPVAAVEPEATHCDCGGAYAFDATLEGETCGGVQRAGWLVCSSCGATCVTRRGCEVGGWTISSSGVSINVPGGRLRMEGRGADNAAVMRRIARLPDLEAALRAIARGDADPVAIARGALEVPT